MSEDARTTVQKNERRIGFLSIMLGVGSGAFMLFVAYDLYSLWHGLNEEPTQANFGKCAICHSLEPDKHSVGPTLHCVVDRRAGSLTGYQPVDEVARGCAMHNMWGLD